MQTTCSSSGIAGATVEVVYNLCNEVALLACCPSPTICRQTELDVVWNLNAQWCEHCAFRYCDLIQVFLTVGPRLSSSFHLHVYPCNLYQSSCMYTRMLDCTFAERSEQRCWPTEVLAGIADGQRSVVVNTRWLCNFYYPKALLALAVQKFTSKLLTGVFKYFCTSKWDQKTKNLQ
jgi:hypothetical protein